VGSTLGRIGLNNVRNMWNLHRDQMLEISQLDHLSSHKERDENKSSLRNKWPMLPARKEERRKAKQVPVI